MAEIFHFTPRQSLHAQDNLDEFIRRCRDDLTVFGSNLDWNADQWAAASIQFGNLDQTTRKLDPANVLQSPFCGFAKAYLRYQQGHRPTKSKQEMRAIKCIERALVEYNADAVTILNVNSAILDRAATLAREYFSPGQAYHAGRELQRLATFVSDKGLIPGRLDWKNPNSRPNDRNRTGKKAKERRERSLPDDDALNALADIFANQPAAPRDIFTTSVAGLLLCAPARVSEVLSLPVNCEVRETKRDGEEAYGVRFQPGKRGDPQIKWIPSSMETLAEEAIARLRLLTEEPRRLAYWLEEYPGHFYRHDDCPDVPEDQPLTVIEVCQALGFVHSSQQRAVTALRSVNLPARNGANTLRFLNEWVHSKLPKGFPWFDAERGIRYSEALLCLNTHQLRADMTTSPVRLAKPNANWVNDDLQTGFENNQKTRRSVFDRYGYNDQRSELLKITSHQFRHLLNTMAQRGGLSQSEVARWSGRADMKQNRDYDHMSEFELVDMLRSRDESLALDGPLEELADQISAKTPMTRQEFNSLSMPTAHITELGFCVHDFTMSPCQRHRDCLNCSEQVCVKGDKRLDGLYDVYDKAKRLREQAEQEIAEGSAGADRWYEHQCKTEARARELISVMENPDIVNGAIVKLRNPNEFSPLRRAVESRVSDEDTVDEEERTMLEDMRNLLGGEGIG